VEHLIDGRQGIGGPGFGQAVHSSCALT
jgi:hypothetical protein